MFEAVYESPPHQECTALWVSGSIEMRQPSPFVPLPPIAYALVSEVIEDCRSSSDVIPYMNDKIM